MEHIKSEHLLLAQKRIIPSLENRAAIPRSHLYQWLDSSTASALTLITAPAGFGKTTLVSNWLQARGVDTAWVSLGSSENDVVLFWQYVIFSINSVFPVLADEIQREWPEGFCAQDIEEVVITVINSLTALPASIVLVFDNYHAITEPEIHRTLLFLLEYAPKSLKCIILTRKEPAFVLARLRVHAQLYEMHADSLRFTLEETEAFFLSMGLSLSRSNIVALHTQTRGWAAALYLAARTLEGKDDPAAITQSITSFSGKHRHVFSFLTEEVLSHQPEDVQSFLLATSILERLHPSLCECLTARSDSHALLDWLEGNGLFLTFIDDEPECYRYDQLFREALLQHVQQYNPKILPPLHLRASSWFEQRQEFEAAIKHAFAANASERVVQLLEQWGWNAIQQGKAALVATWIAQLPEQLVTERPMLGYLSASSSLAMGDFGQYTHALTLAESMWHEEGNQQAQARLADLRSYTAGQGEKMIARARYALALAPEQDVVTRSSASVMLGVGYLLMGQLESAAPALYEGAKLSEHCQYVPAMDLATLGIAELHIQRGLLHEAEQHLQHYIAHDEQKVNHNLWFRIFAHIRLASIYHQWDNTLAAHEQREQAELLLEHVRGKTPELTSLLTAYLAWNRGEKTAVSSALKQAMLDETRSQLPLSRVIFLLLRLCLLQQKDLSQEQVNILIHEGQADVEKEQALSSYEHDISLLLRARLYLLQDQPRQAIRLLRGQVQIAKSQGRVEAELALLVLLALALDKDGARVQAFHVLERALKLAEPGNYVRIFLDEGRPMAVLLAAYAHSVQNKNTSHTASSRFHLYMHRLLSKSSHNAHAPLTLIPSVHNNKELIEPLSEREMDVLILMTQGSSNALIAQQLVVTVSTVKTHLNNIYAKLQVHTRLQAVMKAYEIGLLDRNTLDNQDHSEPPLQLRISR